MAIEVERLKKEGVSGIIVDVRDNGGGSLKTVVDIAGLFITEGPIVQVKSAGKNKRYCMTMIKNRMGWSISCNGK